MPKKLIADIYSGTKQELEDISGTGAPPAQPADETAGLADPAAVPAVAAPTTDAATEPAV